MMHMHLECKFLQLREMRAHRSALGAIEELQNWISSKQIHAKILSKVNVDTAENDIDKELTTGCKKEVAVWAYLMTQYNLKPGLRKFGGVKAAVSELMQLHIMDTWSFMGPKQLMKEDKARALLSLLFLKEKNKAERSRGEHSYMECHRGRTSPQRTQCHQLF